ncbi:MAG: NfeD family protein [Planctomycetota bacterium]
MALLIVGLLLLMVEIFVLPGFGIAGVLGILCILGGLFGMLVKNGPDEVPWPETTLDWELFLNGVLGLSLGFVGFVVLAWLLTKHLPKLEFLSGLILVPSWSKQANEMRVSMTGPPEVESGGVKVGSAGEVVATLRPAGKVKFGDCIVDCVAEGDFLATGTRVTIIGIRGNRVVVKGVENDS